MNTSQTKNPTENATENETENTAESQITFSQAPIARVDALISALEGDDAAPHQADPERTELDGSFVGHRLHVIEAAEILDCLEYGEDGEAVMTARNERGHFMVVLDGRRMDTKAIAWATCLQTVAGAGPVLAAMTGRWRRTRADERLDRGFLTWVFYPAKISWIVPGAENAVAIEGWTPTGDLLDAETTALAA